MSIINTLFISIIKAYQKYISPLSAPSCRFYPSCSNYAITTFKFNNPFVAFFVVAYRILRCQPLCKDGFDYAITNKLPRALLSSSTHTRHNRLLLNIKKTHKQKRIIYLFLPLKDSQNSNSKKYKIIQTII